MKEIFIDTDVILDLLLKRKNFYYEAAQIFSLKERKKIKLYTSSQSILNIYYIITRLKNKKFAKESILKLIRLIKILPASEKNIKSALNSELADFEDAVHVYIAQTKNLGCLVTRNYKHYKKSAFPIFSPKEALSQIQSKNQA